MRHKDNLPVLLLQSRPEDEVCENEFEAICSFGEIGPSRVVRLRMERDELRQIDLGDYSAVIMGGGPANFASEEADKSDDQRGYEGWLIDLMREIIRTDKPFLGMCLGVGAVSMALVTRPSFDFHEDVGAVEVTLSQEGLEDPLFQGAPGKFNALVGHKEGVGNAPEGSVELARSATCVQVLRCGENVYATQYHPELNIAGLAIRVEAYKHHGYFSPEEGDALVVSARGADISFAPLILKRFAKRYL